MDAANGYFSDAPEGEAEPTVAEKPKDEAKTALIPIDFFQGKELTPGSTCEIKVEQVMDDQVSVSYLESESPESEEMETETTEPSTPPASEDMFS
jgi:hypothetical protein